MRRGAQHAAQAFQLGEHGAGLGGVPQGHHVRVRELGKHLEAALLRLDQVQQALLLVGHGAATGKQGRACRPFLAGEFLALHEVEQGDQQARDLRVAGAVRRLEHHRQQTGDQPHIGLGGPLGCPFQRLDASAQAVECVQPVQHIGDAAEQAGTVAQPGRFGVQFVKAGAQLGLDLSALADLLMAHFAEPQALGAQEQVGQSPLALQAMHQAPGHVHQRAGQGELLQLGDFAAFGRQQKVQARFHVCGVVASIPRS